MRLKEFIIFLFIFTICYILFFILWDRKSLRDSIKKEKKRVIGLIEGNKFSKFAMFYGLQATLSNDVIFLIFQDIQQISRIKISFYSNKYGISSQEFVVLFLYFEFLSLISRKAISVHEDFIYPISIADQNLIHKYDVYFKEKDSFEVLTSKLGNGILKDISHLEYFLLVPGVRFIQSQLYYVGDIS